MIDEALAAELLWLWDARNRQHLFELERREIDQYALGDFERAERAVDALLGRLSPAPAAPAGCAQ